MKEVIYTCDFCKERKEKVYNKEHPYKIFNKSIFIDGKNNNEEDFCEEYIIDIRFETITCNTKDICKECILKAIKNELFPETPKVENSDSGSSDQ